MLKRDKLIPPIMLFFLVFGGSLTFAQESSIPAGGDASGSGGTVAYSVGQVFYTTDNGTSGSVTQGVQQPFEIYVTGISDIDFNVSLSVFPNPTTTYLTLQIDDFKGETLLYQLYDAKGTLLNSADILQKSTEINTSELAQATYMLYVIAKSKKTIQSYKIIKN